MACTEHSITYILAIRISITKNIVQNIINMRNIVGKHVRISIRGIVYENNNIHKHLVKKDRYLPLNMVVEG